MKKAISKKKTVAKKNNIKKQTTKFAGINKSKIVKPTEKVTEDAPKNSSDELSIEFTITVKANVGEVWHALTDKDELENWWGEGVIIQSMVGGKFQEKWEDDDGNKQLASGRIKIAERNKKISFTWREKGWPVEVFTNCTFLIQAQGLGGLISQITMQHTGWERLPEESRAKLMKDFKIGWGYHMKELKAYLDE